MPFSARTAQVAPSVSIAYGSTCFSRRANASLRAANIFASIEDPLCCDTAPNGNQGRAGSFRRAVRTVMQSPFHQLGRIGSVRSEEHTSELQSLMPTSYAV